MKQSNTRPSGKEKNNDLKLLIADGDIDLMLLVFLLALLVIGLVLLFSASYVKAYYDSGNPYYYIARQSIGSVSGVVFMFFISKIKYQYLRLAAVPLMIVAFLLLILVLVHPHVIPGKENMKRWLGFGPITFQPSEVAKFALILFLAFSMERRSKLLQTKVWAGFPYIALVGLVCALVVLENHLSGTMILAAIGILMVYFGGMRVPLWLYILGAGFIVGAAYLLIRHPQILQDYMGERITAWLNKDYDPLGARYQVNQSLYAIGSGGLFGTGLGASKQKYLYIPEPQNDFIFAIVCEELGFIGALSIVLLFALLVWRGVTIGIRARDKFGALLALGIMMQIGVQVALNIMVVTDTIPNTGISLPFFSYGGTALLMQLGEMGIVLGISRSANVSKMETGTPKQRVRVGGKHAAQ